MGVRGLVTDTWVVSEGGCASVASGDLRSGAPHTILSFSYPILSYPTIVSYLSYPIILSYPMEQQQQRHVSLDHIVINISLNRHQTILGVYVNKLGKTSVGWRYTLQSVGPSGIALNH